MRDNAMETAVGVAEVVRDGLVAGAGVEDIAVRSGKPVALIRSVVQHMRVSGELLDLVKEARREARRRSVLHS